MAFTIINTTDTLEQMRVKLNNLTTNDFGDPSILPTAGISATSICGAIVELGTAVYSSVGFRIEDSSSSFQIVAPGETFRIFGTSNQINATVSSPDRLTLSFPNNITIPNNLTANGTLHTLGTVEISGNSIRSTNTTSLQINDDLSVTGSITTGSSLNVSNLNLTQNGVLTFEGSTNDNFETTLTVVDPTQDRTITFPNVTGTVITNGDTGSITNTMIADTTIQGGKIANSTISSNKFASVTTLQIINSAGTVLKTIYGAGS
jgi:hypothetical protein